jgi:hypothetical protein
VVSKRQVYKKSGLQKVRLSKSQFSKRLVSKRTVFKFDILIMVIYGKKLSKIENKTEPAHFHQPQVPTEFIWMFFATGRFEDLTFCKPDVLKT